MMADKEHKWGKGVKIGGDETLPEYGGVLSKKNIDFLRKRFKTAGTHLGMRHTHSDSIRKSAAIRANEPEPAFHGDAFDLTPEKYSKEELESRGHGALAQGLVSDAEHNQSLKASIRNAVEYSDKKHNQGETSEHKRLKTISENSEFAIADFGLNGSRYDDYKDSYGNKTGNKFGSQKISGGNVKAQLKIPENRRELDAFDELHRDEGKDPVIEHATEEFSRQVNSAIDTMRSESDHLQHTEQDRRDLMAAAAMDRMNPIDPFDFDSVSNLEQVRARISKRINS